MLTVWNLIDWGSVIAGFLLMGWALYGLVNARRGTARVLAPPRVLAAFYIGLGFLLVPVSGAWILTRNPAAWLAPLMIGAGLGVLLGALRTRRHDKMMQAADAPAKETF